MERSVKLLPNFDLRASGAAAEWKLWRTCFEDYLVSTGQDGASDKIRLALLRNMIGMGHGFSAGVTNITDTGWKNGKF